jgi:hypothetical protein
MRTAVLMVALLAVAAGLSAGLLFILPAALIVVMLALGCYPGEHALAALDKTVRVRRRPVLLAGSCGERAPRVVVPLGAALLAFKRAVRPPPSLTTRLT